MRSLVNRLVLALVVASVMLHPDAHASVPSLLHYQGVLTDAGGTPITTNTSVTFTLWSTPIAGTVRWTETRSVTPDSEGRFAILLGQAVPLHDTVFKMPPLYLGVQVAADPELMPRSLLSSNAFAFRISTIDGATGGNIVGDMEVFSSGSGTGLGVRDPGGDRGGYSPTSAVFTDVNSDTLVQVGTGGVTFIEPTSGDTIFDYDPAMSALEIGLNNSALGSQSVALGTSNLVLGDNAFAIGTGNTVDSNNAFAIGTSNLASGRNSFVSGSGNFADGKNSAVLAGQENSVWGDNSTVGGGFWNAAYGPNATVAGGAIDTALGNHSTIGGGARNKTFGASSVIPGGEGNFAFGEHSLAAGFYSQAMHPGTFVWSDAAGAPGASSSANNQWTARTTGGARFFTNAALTTGVTLAAGGGSWAAVSDRDVKENIHTVSGMAILSKLCELPIAEWNYISQDDSIHHIGPMAQDFYAAFGVGEDDKHITSIDADGVALAAIQALNEKLNSQLNAQRSENDELRAQIAELREMIRAQSNKQK